MSYSSHIRRIVAVVSLVVMASFMIWKMRTTIMLRDYNHKINKYRQHISQSSRQRQQRRRLSSYHHRPIIYTFYAPLLRAVESPREQKTRRADQELLQVWKEAWTQAGWEPKVIGLMEAKNHPMYASYQEKLDQVELLGKGGRNEEYNEYCFLRFLAMAQVGGGTMADYDMFPLQSGVPLSTPLLSDRFTVFQETLNKAGPVPALCSGSITEWERMAHLILQIAQEPPPPPAHGSAGWSDMTALMALHKTAPDSMYMVDYVVGSHEVDQLSTMQAKCRFASQKWAIHFSHYDVIQTGHRVLDRPQVAKTFLDQWNSECIKH